MNSPQDDQVGQDPQAREQEQVHREAGERVGVWEPQHLAVQDGQEADQGQRDPGVVPPLQARKLYKEVIILTPLDFTQLLPNQI